MADAKILEGKKVLIVDDEPDVLEAKDRLFEIDVFLTDVLVDGSKNRALLGKWFDRLKGYYENKFGPGWLDEYKGAWQ